jgi:branched-chain amino acid transport system ATP-binding protein
MGEPLLTTRKLSNHFGMVCTARDLDLSFERGVLTSIIGPNGAGKSTLINLLTGHLPVQTGEVFFEGREITRLPIHERVRMGICRSFQIVNVFPRLTVAQNVMIPVLARTGRARSPFRSLSGERAAMEETLALLERVGLAGERETTATALSHGDLRLLEVAVALAAAPRLLFLDEPTAGMNPVERVRLLDSIRQLAKGGGTTFVVVEHDMDVVFSLSERIIVLHRGEILCDGTPAQVRADGKVREVYLGDDVSDLFRYQEEEV